MNDSTINLLEDTIYEVIITSWIEDVNFKPFGIKFSNNKVILNLYPNKTLYNLKVNPEFIIQFTQNPLIYTKALFNQLTTNDYDENYILHSSDFIINAKVSKIIPHNHKDEYGNVILTQIIADIIQINQINYTPPIINRATNKILDLLIEYTRLPFMDINKKNTYEDKLINSEDFIKKTGNKLHMQSLKILKKEFNMEE